jgi:hypothetical protein
MCLPHLRICPLKAATERTVPAMAAPAVASDALKGLQFDLNGRDFHFSSVRVALMTEWFWVESSNANCCGLLPNCGLPQSFLSALISGEPENCSTPKMGMVLCMLRRLVVVGLLDESPTSSIGTGALALACQSNVQTIQVRELGRHQQHRQRLRLLEATCSAPMARS